jgi:hypothetical protein
MVGVEVAGSAIADTGNSNVTTLFRGPSRMVASVTTGERCDQRRHSRLSSSRTPAVQPIEKPVDHELVRRTERAGPNPLGEDTLGEILGARRGLHRALRIPRSGQRRGAEAQVSILGGSRTTWERAAAGQNGVFVMIDGVWPLPPRGPRSL